MITLNNTQSTEKTMSKQIPFILDLDMVSAIKDGGQRVLRKPVEIPLEYSENTGFSFKDKGGTWWACGLGSSERETMDNLVQSISPIKKGDLIWVRETFCEGRIDEIDAEHPDDRHKYIDQSECNTNYIIYRQAALCDGINMDDVKWSPSVHMRKEASRLTLKVTDVELENTDDRYVWVVKFEVIRANIMNAGE
jgi:hypothetical protein